MWVSHSGVAELSANCFTLTFLFTLMTSRRTHIWLSFYLTDLFSDVTWGWACLSKENRDAGFLLARCTSCCPTQQYRQSSTLLCWLGLCMTFPCCGALLELRNVKKIFLHCSIQSSFCSTDTHNFLHLSPFACRLIKTYSARSYVTQIVCCSAHSRESLPSHSVVSLDHTHTTEYCLMVCHI